MKLGDLRFCRLIPFFHALSVNSRCLLSTIKYRRLIQLAGILVVIPILAVGCTGNPVAKPRPEPYFPVQKEVPKTVHLALLPGTLVMDENGYLSVQPANALVIWPYGYSFKIEGEDIWVIDSKGRPFVRVGDEIRDELGGGYVPRYVAEDRMGQPLPVGWKGNYFLAAGAFDESTP